MINLENQFKNQIIDRLYRLNNSRQSNAFVIFGRPVKAIAQAGPTCGLVSLMMAEQVLNRSKLNADPEDTSRKLSELLNLAIKKQFTKQGEMFVGTYFPYKVYHPLL